MGLGYVPYGRGRRSGHDDPPRAENGARRDDGMARRVRQSSTVDLAHHGVSQTCGGVAAIWAVIYALNEKRCEGGIVDMGSHRTREGPGTGRVRSVGRVGSHPLVEDLDVVMGSGCP